MIIDKMEPRYLTKEKEYQLRFKIYTKKDVTKAIARIKRAISIADINEVEINVIIKEP